MKTLDSDPDEAGLQPGTESKLATIDQLLSLIKTVFEMLRGNLYFSTNLYSLKRLSVDHMSPRNESVDQSIVWFL